MKKQLLFISALLGIMTFVVSPLYGAEIKVPVDKDLFLGDDKRDRSFILMFLQFRAKATGKTTVNRYSYRKLTVYQK